MTVAKVWINGELHDETAAIDARDRGVLLADGAFETIRVENGRAFFWDDHRTRLAHGLSVLGMDATLVFRAIGDVDDVIARLSEANAVSRQAVLRLTVTRGIGSRGVAPPVSPSPTILMTLASIRDLSASAASHKTVGVYRDNQRVKSVFNTFKYLGGYGINTLAKQWAARNGYDDALLINEKGALTGATVATVFLFMPSGNVITPPIADGALPGTTRARILAAAGDIREETVDQDALASAQLLLVNALSGSQRARLHSSDGVATAEQAAAQNRIADIHIAQLQEERARLGIDTPLAGDSHESI